MKGKFKSVILGALVMSTSSLYASTSSSSGIAGIADSVASNLSSVAELISQVAFVAGLGFFVSSVFKFKQHKDNPTQVPIGTPMSMLAIAAALMFMANFIAPLGETLFGADAQAGASSQAATATGGVTQGLSST